LIEPLNQRFKKVCHECGKIWYCTELFKGHYCREGKMRCLCLQCNIKHYESKTGKKFEEHAELILLLDSCYPDRKETEIENPSRR